MSSHHFVKEKQEPALLILADEEINVPLLQSLLEWSPLVVADEKTLFLLNHDPIKIDVVLHSAMPSDHLEVFIGNQDGIAIVGVQFDHTVMQAGLEYLKRVSMHTACNIIGAKVSDFLNLQNHFSGLDLIFYNSEQRAFFVDSTFSKWKQKGSKLIIHDPEISYSNLRGEAPNYEVVADGLVSIKSSKRFSIIEIERNIS